MTPIDLVATYRTALHPCSVESIIFPRGRGTFLCGQYELDATVATDVSNETAPSTTTEVEQHDIEQEKQDCISSSSATATRSGAIDACSWYENHVLSFIRATSSGVLDMKVAGSYVASALSNSTVTIDRYEPFHANNDDEEEDDETQDVDEFRRHVYDRVSNLIDDDQHKTNDAHCGVSRRGKSGSSSNQPLNDAQNKIRNTCTSVLSLTAENEGLFLSVDWDVAFTTQPGNQSIYQSSNLRHIIIIIIIIIIILITVSPPYYQCHHHRHPHLHHPPSISTILILITNIPPYYQYHHHRLPPRHDDYGYYEMILPPALTSLSLHKKVSQNPQSNLQSKYQPIPSQIPS